MKEGRGGGGIFDNIAFKKAKKKFGGRIRLVVCGGAPLPSPIHEFVSVLFGCPVVQGYGLTETCGGTCIGNIQDRVFAQVGPPLACCEVKLVSVPELDYNIKDNTGEVWIRGYNVSKGYYKDEEKTKEDFDEEGWFHTGDIGRWNENGTLSIIDRKKNIFKLSQGEYIPAEALEGLYKCKYISQLWIHGISTENYIVAVGSVNPITLQQMGKQMELGEDVDELCKNEHVKQMIIDELTAAAKEHERPRFEWVKKIHLFNAEFNTDNDLATPTMKLKRPQLAKFFKDEIEAMYELIHEEEKK
jgi:long-chain acyl-CoA synthetase